MSAASISEGARALTGWSYDRMEQRFAERAAATTDKEGRYELTPRRHQIIDYLDWFERQLAKLQVKVLLNTPLDGEEAKAMGADVVIIATGSLPDGKAFQRAMPEHDALPGIERGNHRTVRGATAIGSCATDD